MYHPRNFFNRIVVLVALALSSLAVTAQTLTITNGVQKYASLASTTVNLSGRCELWVTNAATPLTGCVVSLNSVDAWLFLPNVKPSVAASTYLAQVRVNGASAAADGNVRVVQYGQNGAVVIPHSASFQPLTGFTGAEFTGTPTQYSQWAYYKGSGFSNIRSFKLKRGYQVVFAQSSDGKNWSKCYVAQDGDLEIGALPATLDKQVQFIYVTPWRWTSKKGIAGNPGNSWLNLNWWYDWNLDQSSSRDLEYVAIRQNQYWPSLSQNWRTLGVNTVLGYNEPDQANQANMSVGAAIGSWGDLLGTGLRVGSPATSDGGVNSWLIPFVSQADAAGLRVDFVGVHYYQSHNPADAAGCASQMYNFLLNIWNNTHRPIWITEWNNGANWTDSQWPVPTYAQQQACVQAMVNMLESTPFVERYALYNWVEDGRSLVNGANAVTLAGTVYSNTISSLSYSQAMPDNGTRGIAEYLFATNIWDTSGYYNNGMAIGAPAFTTGHNSQAQAIALDGTNSYLQLPANIAKGGAFTFAAWVYWNGGANWQRIFDFGKDTSHYLFLSPSSGSTTLRFAINNGSGEQTVERSGALAAGSWQHVAITLNGNTATLYVNGAPVVISTSFSIVPSAFSPFRNYLGKSQFTADPLFNGKLDDVEIADYALPAAQILALYYHSMQNPAFIISGVWTNDADGNWSDTNNWSSGVIANGTSRMADFSTVSLTADRTVTLDGARTIGGLRFGNLIGSQNWFLSGANTLTLDGGGANAPMIAVNQNNATISTPLAGTNGLVKTGNGTLALNAANNLGGGLVVNAGALSIIGGTTTFGSGTSTIGYLTGNGNLTMTAGSLATAGEFRVGGSDQSGAQYMATGMVTVANSTLSVGSLTVARGNYLDNSISGTLTLNNGSTLVSTNDAVVEFAGTGHGKLVINGGNFLVGPTASKWLVVGYWDAGAGELDITNGGLFLENGSSIKLVRGNNNTGANAVNQAGGAVTFYSDAGATVGGGNLDLNYAGGASSSGTYNLNGGTLTVPQIIASSSAGNSTFNFNGGTLEPAASSTTFMQGLTGVNLRNNGAKIDTAGFNVAIAQALSHSAIAGDNAIDGGLVKNGAGTLTLSGANTYTGATTINAGTLALSGGGSIASSPSISIGGGATLNVVSGLILGAAQMLTGGGTIQGNLSVNGTLTPGGGIGVLTCNNNVTLQPGSTMVMELNSSLGTNDQLVVSGALAYAGTLHLTNLSGNLAGGDTFKLFDAASSSGNFSAISGSPGAGLDWKFNPATGTLVIYSTVPAGLVFGIANNNLSISWPADHVGWMLQVQTNDLNAGLGTNWISIPSSAGETQFTAPLDAGNSSVFYRLIYQ